MRCRKNLTSIAQRIRQSTVSIVGLLMLPVALSLVIMLVYAGRYQGIIGRMEQAAALKPLVSTRISEQLFSVAAGRVRFEESELEELTRQVDAQLQQMSAVAQGDARLQLTVATRTMETLEGYIEEVRTGMEEGRPIRDIEYIVDEVRDVGNLVVSMLEEFISTEIGDAARTNQRMSGLLAAAAFVEVALVVITVLLSAHNTRRVNRSIATSISRLEDVVHQITGGNMTARVRQMDVEELQELADQVNVMANTLETLIVQIRTEQENLAKSELRTLQAQINPHFLYNTLDTIIWQAESGKAEEVIRLTSSLSDFFRITLSSGADWIRVPQEIQHISGYLSIQKTRYRDILNYSIDVPPELSEVYMVKFLLQPLVENALYHGIRARRGGGTITIRAREKDGKIRFSVQDTGRGMSPEQLRNLKESLQVGIPSVQKEDMENRSGYGLRNVDLRIRLYYMQEKGLEIESDSSGTTVSFTVPSKTQAEIENGTKGGALK